MTPNKRAIPAGSAYHAVAFTLVELLVVIAIIGVLISILLPSVRLVRGNAITVLCAQNLANVGVSGRLFAIDRKIPAATPYWFFRNGSGDYPHEGGSGGISSPRQPGNPALALYKVGNHEMGYLPEPRNFWCPSYELDFDEFFHPAAGNVNGHKGFWGTYVWHYRIVNAKDDEYRKITRNQIKYAQYHSRYVAMTDTTFHFYGLTPQFAWERRWEHYNALLVDGGVSRIANTASEYRTYLWGSKGRPY